MLAMPEHDSVRIRSRSPSTAAPEIKRRRKTVSCSLCRQRKVGCDRGLPSCSRCTKAGLSASCSYTSDATGRVPAAVYENNWITNGDVSASSHHAAFPADTITPVTQERGNPLHDKLIRRLQHQIAELQRHNSSLLVRLDTRLPKIIARTSEDGFSPKHHSASPSERYREERLLCDTETILLRGKGFRTQFYGPELSWNPPL